jgi:hypothetical protein
MGAIECKLAEFELLLELKIEQKTGTSPDKLVLSRENPRHRQCADRTSVRPSYIFLYQHIELAGTAPWYSIIFCCNQSLLICNYKFNTEYRGKVSISVRD